MMLDLEKSPSKTAALNTRTAIIIIYSRWRHVSCDVTLTLAGVCHRDINNSRTSLFNSLQLAHCSQLTRLATSVRTVNSLVHIHTPFN